LLQGKMNDPIAAAVGAYALLRFADLTRLHDWTKNLCDWFPWLPDSAAIRAEHLARSGDHAAAIEIFLSLRERGVPMFTDGLSYALDRLRLYTDTWRNELDAGQRDRLDWLFDHLKRLAPAVDFGSPVLRLVGDPLELLAETTSAATADSPEAAVVEPATASA
jgi:hypothetical protein